MTTEIDLDSMIRTAMASGIVHSLIPRETADLMRARLDEMTSAGHKPDGCPVCLVRALTEGEPKVWFPSEPASVKGVVLRTGDTPAAVNVSAILGTSNLPYVDLWLGGMDHIRLVGFGSLGRELERLAPTVGDTLTVTYTGQGTIQRGKYTGRAYRAHTVEITRGHH